MQNSRVWDIATNGTAYVAGGNDGKIAYFDGTGTTWSMSSQTVFSGVSVRGIAYGGGRFVAVGATGNGDSSRAVVGYSTDNGKTWTAGTINGIGDNRHLYSVIYDGTRFVAVGQWGQVAYSTNGQTWTRFFTDGSGGKHLLSVAYGGNRYFAVGLEGRTLTATDPTKDGNGGWEWAVDTLFGGTKDTPSWDTDDTSDNNLVTSIVYGNNMFVAVGNWGYMKTWSSGAASNWTTRTSGFQVTGEGGAYTHILKVVFGGGKFLAVGDNGKVSSSTNGTTWTAITPGTEAGQTQYVAEEYISAACSMGDGKFILSGNRYWDVTNPLKGKTVIITP
jgi:hypothetical protein